MQDEERDLEARGSQPLTDVTTKIESKELHRESYHRGATKFTARNEDGQCLEPDSDTARGFSVLAIGSDGIDPSAPNLRSSVAYFRFSLAFATAFLAATPASDPCCSIGPTKVLNGSSSSHISCPELA